MDEMNVKAVETTENKKFGRRSSRWTSTAAGYEQVPRGRRSHQQDHLQAQAGAGQWCQGHPLDQPAG